MSFAIAHQNKNNESESKTLTHAKFSSRSHHHGIGKLRHEFMERTISPASVEMIKELKQANDPQNIFGIRNNVLAG